MQKKMRYLSIPYDYAQICKPYLVKLPKDVNQLFPRIPYNSCAQKCIEKWSQ